MWDPCGTGCSGHGCCLKTPQGGICVCDGGYQGSYCEYNNCMSLYIFVCPLLTIALALSYVQDFTEPNGSPTTGWGNGYTYYRSDHESIANGLLTITLDTEGCPASTYSKAIISCLLLQQIVLDWSMFLVDGPVPIRLATEYSRTLLKYPTNQVLPLYPFLYSYSWYRNWCIARNRRMEQWKNGLHQYWVLRKST